MDNNKKLFEELLKADGIDPFSVSESDRNNFAKILDQQLKQKKTKPIPRPGIWRTIMQSRITKFVAAAVVIISVTVGLNISGGPTMSSVAWCEVLEVIEKVPTVIFKMRNVITYSENKTMSTKSEVYDGAEYGVRVDMYMNSELVMQKYMIPEQKVAYMIRPKEKMYSRFTLTETQTQNESDTPRQWVQTILSENYTELGRNNINGIDVEGVEVQNSKLLAGDEGMVRLWVDIETNLPVRMELEGKMMEAGVKRPMKIIMEDFQWNVELDNEIFEPNIPDDYKLMEVQKRPNIKKDSSKILSDKEKIVQAKIKETVVELFQACTDENWDKFLELTSGTSISNKKKSNLAGLKVISIGDPFKTDDSDMWYVPSQIEFKSGAIDGKTLEIRYDETTKRYIICGQH